MSASNKLIFSIAQDLNDDEQNRACKNIGAVRSYILNTFTGSHKITQAEASSGTLDFSVFFDDIGGVLLYNIGIEVPASANLGQNVYPVIVKLNFTFEGEGKAYETVATGVLCRTGNGRPWDLCANFSYDFYHINQKITALTLSLDWGQWTIPQSTEIIYTLRSSMLRVPKM